MNDSHQFAVSVKVDVSRKKVHFLDKKYQQPRESVIATCIAIQSVACTIKFCEADEVAS